MGFDGIFSVYKCNSNTQKYEKLAFYDKNGNALSDLFPSRDGMLNQLLLGYSRRDYSFESIGARRGLPDWYIEILKEEHPDYFDDNGEYMYNADEGTYYDYLELYGWAQSNACDFKDWYADYTSEDEGPASPPIYNPLKPFMEKVDVYLSAYGVYYPKPGEIIIICEMSY